MSDLSSSAHSILSWTNLILSGFIALSWTHNLVCFVSVVCDTKTSLQGLYVEDSVSENLNLEWKNGEKILEGYKCLRKSVVCGSAGVLPEDLESFVHLQSLSSVRCKLSAVEYLHLPQTLPLPHGGHGSPGENKSNTAACSTVTLIYLSNFGG